MNTPTGERRPAGASLSNWGGSSPLGGGEVSHSGLLLFPLLSRRLKKPVSAGGLVGGGGVYKAAPPSHYGRAFVGG